MKVHELEQLLGHTLYETEEPGTFAVFCRVHQGVTPPMYVDLAKGIYWCNGCGNSGLIDQLLRKVHQS
jgi:hypothetical protein